jgi:hypothetical protein
VRPDVRLAPGVLGDADSGAFDPPSTVAPPLAPKKSSKEKPPVFDPSPLGGGAGGAGAGSGISGRHSAAGWRDASSPNTESSEM